MSVVSAVPKSLDKQGQAQATTASNNLRLEQIYTNTPTWLNRELTLPARFNPKAIYESDLINEDIETMMQHVTRVIITPETFAKLSKAKKLQVTTLASPYECGRVLEADQPILIDGIPHIITAKGGGCTEFARSTGAENPWMMARNRSFCEEDQNKLRQLAFWQDHGSFHKQYAIDELAGERRLKDRNIDCEKILQILELTHLPDKAGRFQKIDWFKDRGILAESVQPCLLIRALKSNLRLLDPIMLDHLSLQASIPSFFEHTIRLWGTIEGTAQPTSNDYYQWLYKKVFSQELDLILQGFQMSSGFWQDLGRNISIMGEELDLEDVDISEHVLTDYGYYIDHVEQHTQNIQTVLLRYGDLLQYFGNGNIDFTQIEECIVDTIKENLNKNRIESIYDTFMQHEQLHRNFPRSPRELHYRLVKATVSLFAGYSVCGLKSAEAQQHQDILKKRFQRLQ